MSRKAEGSTHHFACECREAYFKKLEKLHVTHTLKMHPKYFQVGWVGNKSFEIRKNDREFREHDEITLQECDGEDYSGREIHGVIQYVTDFQQKKGYVVFSYRPTLLTE